MNLGTWKSIKSPVMQEIRTSLKKKAGPGEPTPSKKEANRVWREEILGIKSELQKKEDKERRQTRQQTKSRRYREEDEE